MVDNIQIYYQNTSNGQVFDISTLVSEVKTNQYIDGQPGKCTLTIQDDPFKRLELTSGSFVSVIVDSVGMFFGRIFQMKTDQKESYNIICYDQLRYLKNEEVYITQNQTADQIFNKVCEEMQLRTSIKSSSPYVCPKKLHDKKSRYTIIQYALDVTTIELKKKFFIRDDFGVIIFTDLQSEKTDLVIGDKSLLTDYDYNVSIDDDTYNEVKVYQEDEEKGKRNVWIIKDSNNQTRWGTLKLLRKADKEMNESQIVEMANNLLKVKNRETKTLKLKALGEKELKAGSGFVLNLNRLGIKEYMWIDAITHIFKKDLHLMEMDVFIL